MDLSFFSKKSKPLIGLDISSSAVKMVELSGKSADDAKVERYAIEALPKGAVAEGNIGNLELVIEAVSRCSKRLGSSARNVVMALPSSAVITKRILVPEDLREDELELRIESEANQYIPFAIDEVNLDYQIAGPAPQSPGDVEVLIAASKKERIEDRVAVAEAAGLKASIVDIESFAALASFELVERQLPEKGRKQISALIDIGASSTNVIVLKDGQQLFTREQTIGGNQLTQDIVRNYGMQYEEAEVAKLTGNLPDGYEEHLLTPFLESIALEISRSLQFFFTSSQYSRIDNIVLAGGCAVIPGISEVVGARTQIRTVIANPFARMDKSNRVNERGLLVDAPSLMIACGLALRKFDDPC